MSELRELELSIERARELIATKNAIERLNDDANFKRVILDGYLKNEAVRLVLLKADQNFQSAEDQKQLDKSIEGISYFASFMRTQLQLGRMAEKELADNQEILAEYMQES